METESTIHYVKIETEEVEDGPQPQEKKAKKYCIILGELFLLGVICWCFILLIESHRPLVVTLEFKHTYVQPEWAKKPFDGWDDANTWIENENIDATIEERISRIVSRIVEDRLLFNDYKLVRANEPNEDNEENYYLYERDRDREYEYEYEYDEDYNNR